MDDLGPEGTTDGRPPLASVEQWTEGSGCAVKITGELDMSNIESLREVLDPIVAGGHTTLVFDLSELRFIDSSGIALLLVAARQMDSVYLRNPSPGVRRVVEITGLGNILPIEP